MEEKEAIKKMKGKHETHCYRCVFRGTRQGGTLHYESNVNGYKGKDKTDEKGQCGRAGCKNNRDQWGHVFDRGVEGRGTPISSEKWMFWVKEFVGARIPIREHLWAAGTRNYRGKRGRGRLLLQGTFFYS